MNAYFTLLVQITGKDQSELRGSGIISVGKRSLTNFVAIINPYRELEHNEFGRRCLKHYLDATATRSVSLRYDGGGTRHLHVKDLWIQEMFRDYAIDVVKTERIKNIADQLASPNSPQVFIRLLKQMNLIFE